MYTLKRFGCHGSFQDSQDHSGVGVRHYSLWVEKAPHKCVNFQQSLRLCHPMCVSEIEAVVYTTQINCNQKVDPFINTSIAHIDIFVSCHTMLHVRSQSPNQGSNPQFPCKEAWSLNHWMVRKSLLIQSKSFSARGNISWVSSFHSKYRSGISMWWYFRYKSFLSERLLGSFGLILLQDLAWHQPAPGSQYKEMQRLVGQQQEYEG